MRNSNILILVLITAMVSGCGEKEVAEPSPFPQKTTSAAYFYTSDQEDNVGVVRLVEKLEDTCTPVRETITYPDGSKRQIQFRADGSIWRIFEFDPPSSESGTPLLRRETVYENDGLSPRLHTRFSDSGKRTEKGFREIDGRYHIQYFREDLTLEKMVVFNREHEVEEQNFYRPDETQYEKVRVFEKPHSITEYTSVTKYDWRGVPLFTKTSSDGSWTSDVTDIFFPGTEKTEWQVETTSYSTNITLFNRTGKKVRKWEVRDEKMRVEVYSLSSGTNSMLYSQLWNRADKRFTPQGKELHFELDAVNEQDYQVYDETGQLKLLRRLIEFEVGGDKPVSVDYVDSPYSKDRTEYLNENGDVVRIEQEKEKPYTSYRPNKTEEVIDPPRPLDKPIDYERFKFVPFELPVFMELDFTLTVRPVQTFR